MDFRDHFFSLEGRIARLPFLGGLLLLTAISGVVSMIGAAQIWVHRGTAGASVVLVLMAAAALVNAWTALALYAKRLHDLGASGWMGVPILAAGIVGLATGSILSMGFGIVAAITLCLAPGESGQNRWGPAPGTEDEAWSPQ
jgi:uncharacterized membrane protein YhaH (DUF805 family)